MAEPEMFAIDRGLDAQMVSNKKILVVVTGQLRNASDNLENWLDKINFPGADVFFLFYIWDVVGNVDPNKIHLRCLNTKRLNGVGYTEVSANNIYYNKECDITSEISKIKNRLKGRCKFVIENYQDSYLFRAGCLEIGERLKKDSHPWWQGTIPVAFINHMALSWIRKKAHDFDFYIRLQTEAFLDCVALDTSFFENSNLIITSPDTISKNNQISMKFFSGKLDAFSLLMDAYTPSVAAFRDYESTRDISVVPIGERFLWYLAKSSDVEVRYDVRMKVKRQRVIPDSPIWRPTSKVKNEWIGPNLIDLPADEFTKIAKQVTVCQEV